LAADPRTIPIEPLTAPAFAPFGDVLEATGASHPINAGMTDRYHDLARIEAVDGRVAISIGRGRPYALPLDLTLVERHPFGSQAFVPMSEDPFLVVVAPDEYGIPGRPRAFLTAPRQGVNYLLGTWHGVLTPLGRTASFLIVDRVGDGANLEEYTYDTPWRITAG
jgi:ureidoglycolate lyase